MGKSIRIFLVVVIISMLAMLAGCSSKPKSFIVTYDQSTWRVIDIREDFKGKINKIWETLVDTISEKYDLETINKDSGYLRTAWKYTYVVKSQISNKYRSRIVVKVDQDFNQLKIKCDSHWLGDNGWLQGYDTILLENIYSDVQGKLGRVITR
jgi:uncharacterized lipoprotein